MLVLAYLVRFPIPTFSFQDDEGTRNAALPYRKGCILALDHRTIHVFGQKHHGNCT